MITISLDCDSDIEFANYLTMRTRVCLKALWSCGSQGMPAAVADSNSYSCPCCQLQPAKYSYVNIKPSTPDKIRVIPPDLDEVSLNAVIYILKYPYSSMRLTSPR